jgi:5-methylthioadenosine/S-adenosylhomocysteine deaminase
MAEMLLAGTTTFSDMYFFPEVVASLPRAPACAASSHSRCSTFRPAWGSGADEYISKGLALRDDCKSRDRVNVAFGPHAPYTVGPASLEKIATYAAELDMAYIFTCTKPRARCCRRWRPTANAPLTRCVASASSGRARSACT